MFDYRIITKAGLTQQEFADLLGVSRVTVNKWISGDTAPHVDIHSELSSLLERIEQAIDANRLPLASMRGDRKKRRRAIRVALNPPTS